MNDAVKALHGIASCATDCECCRMHKHIAEGALEAFAQFDRLYNLVIVCRRCAALADPDNHVCEE